MQLLDNLRTATVKVKTLQHLIGMYDICIRVYQVLAFKNKS